MKQLLTSYTQRSRDEITADLVHILGLAFYVTLIWVMFCGYIVTPPVWWHA